MFGVYRNKITLILGDGLLVSLSFILSAYIRYEFHIPDEILKFLKIEVIFSFLLIKIFCFNLFALYNGMWRYTSVWDLINILKGSLLASTIIVICVNTYFGFNNISRSLFLIDLILCSILISVLRLGIRLFFSHIKDFLSTKKKYDTKKNVLIVGAGVSGQAILRQSLQNNIPINVIGFLDDDASKIGRKIHGVPIIASLKSINKIENNFDEIYICVPSATSAQMSTIINICKKSNKPVKTLPSLTELIRDEISFSHLREVSIIDLLGRDEIKLNVDEIDKTFKGKRVLVTGAGGSIGSELVRQCLNFSPSILVMVEISELNLFEIDREINQDNSEILFKPVLCDIRDSSLVQDLFDKFKPQVVLHAAAYKHVPIQEKFPWEAIKTNIFGTYNVSVAAVEHGVEKFVLVSTDKAVRPTNVMGATKRLAEMISLYFDRKQDKTEFMAVRFGNVLGSSGSVIPIFQDQIKRGGPLTITDPEMERFFMSIPEASQLILQAGSIGSGGEVFILDMGNPIKIIDIANQLIRLSGFRPNHDIGIEITGARPGEKKKEELSLPTEKLDNTKHDKIFVLSDSDIKDKVLDNVLDDLKVLKENINRKSASELRIILAKILPDYEPENYRKGVGFIEIKNKAEA